MDSLTEGADLLEGRGLHFLAMSVRMTAEDLSRVPEPERREAEVGLKMDMATVLLALARPRAERVVDVPEDSTEAALGRLREQGLIE